MIFNRRNIIAFTVVIIIISIINIAIRLSVNWYLENILLSLICSVLLFFGITGRRFYWGVICSIILIIESVSLIFFVFGANYKLIVNVCLYYSIFFLIPISMSLSIICRIERIKNNLTPALSISEREV